MTGNYQPPHQRARRAIAAAAQTRPVKPLVVPALVAATRLAICELQCGCTGSAICPLHGCCPTPIQQTVELATRSCPAGHWPAWLQISL